ncbi:peptide deformylase [Streptomyces olivaceus]
MDRVGQVHLCAKSMGIAAPLIGIGRAAAVAQPPADAPATILLIPRITARSEETDEPYESCVSFFDGRGLVPRPSPPHPLKNHDDLTRTSQGGSTTSHRLTVFAAVFLPKFTDQADQL